jgi:hypothetical protein
MHGLLVVEEKDGAVGEDQRRRWVEGDAEVEHVRLFGRHRIRFTSASKLMRRGFARDSSLRLLMFKEDREREGD